jgi:cell division septal protein FtsQ
MSGRASSAPHGSERLATRRRKRRRRLLIALGVLALLLCGGVLYGLQQSTVRISRVEVFGADASLARVAQEAMKGSYLGIIPRDSLFFFPEENIRSQIIAKDTDIATISIFRNGLNGLTIKVNTRVPIARWCGATYSPPVGTSTPIADCYVFDDSGFVFATTTAVPLVNSFNFYEPQASTSSSIVGSTLPHVGEFPAAFNFARQLAVLGSPVVAVVIRGNEVDDYLANGTRITYVLTQEQNAYSALVSAGSNLNLKNGSLEYVDLRFERKMYLKKKGGTVSK